MSSIFFQFTAAIRWTSDNMPWPAADNACIRLSKDDPRSDIAMNDKILEAVHTAVDTLTTVTW